MRVRVWECSVAVPASYDLRGRKELSDELNSPNFPHFPHLPRATREETSADSAVEVKTPSQLVHPLELRLQLQDRKATPKALAAGQSCAAELACSCIAVENTTSALEAHRPGLGRPDGHHRGRHRSWLHGLARRPIESRYPPQVRTRGASLTEMPSDCDSDRDAVEPHQPKE